MHWLWPLFSLVPPVHAQKSGLAGGWYSSYLLPESVFLPKKIHFSERAPVFICLAVPCLFVAAAFAHICSEEGKYERESRSNIQYASDIVITTVTNIGY